MQMQSEGRSVEQIVGAIQALDLEPIKFKLMDAEEGQGWSREYVDQMAIAYQRFLTLSVKYPEETIAPSKDVDKFWHGHILDTMKYAEDCQNVYGYFLHHFPYFGMRGAEDAANLAEAGNTTQRLYKQEFGEVASAEAAYCAVAKQAGDAAYCAIAKKAAYCAVAKPANDAAYCAVAEKAAYCAVAKPANEAAYCAVAKKAAYCAVSKPAYCAVAKKAAYCAVAKPANEAAYCAVAKKAAYCAVSKPAYCAVAQTAAYCAVAKPASEVAYCAVANKPANQDKLKTSVRPKLALAA